MTAVSSRPMRASASSISLGGHDQRRQQPHGRRAGRVEHEPLVEQRAAHEPGRVAAVVERDHQPAAAHVRSARAARRGRRAAARPARARTPAAPDRRARRTRRAPPRATSGPPANVEPWSPGWKTSASRSPVTSAPIGSPPPSAFAVVSASGTTPVCSYAHSVPVRPMPRLDLVEHERGADAVAAPRAPRAAAPPRARARPSPPGSARAAPPRCRSCDRRLQRRRLRRDHDEARARAARTAPAWTPAASRSAPRTCGRGRRRAATTISPPGFALRTSFSAASFASAPELQKNTLPPSERLAPAAAASRIAGSV